MTSRLELYSMRQCQLWIYFGESVDVNTFHCYEYLELTLNLLCKLIAYVVKWVNLEILDSMIWNVDITVKFRWCGFLCSLHKHPQLLSFHWISQGFSCNGCHYQLCHCWLLIQYSSGSFGIKVLLQLGVGAVVCKFLYVIHSSRCTPVQSCPPLWHPLVWWCSPGK